MMIKSVYFRYEYDDHYFLTDPKEFIYEFFPLQPEWQLLKASFLFLIMICCLKPCRVRYLLGKSNRRGYQIKN